MFYFHFFMQKNLYFVRKYIWKNLVYIGTFVLQFFRVAGCWKCSYEMPTLIQMCIGYARRHTSTQNTWLQTRYFNVGFDSYGL